MGFDTWVIDFIASERLLMYMSCTQLVGYMWHWPFSYKNIIIIIIIIIIKSILYL